MHKTTNNIGYLITGGLVQQMCCKKYNQQWCFVSLTRAQKSLSDDYQLALRLDQST